MEFETLSEDSMWCPRTRMTSFFRQCFRTSKFVDGFHGSALSGAVRTASKPCRELIIDYSSGGPLRPEC